mgnify:CR=1 FL=1
MHDNGLVDRREGGVWRVRLTRFDRVVLAIIGLLLLGLAATILMGDRVGVTLVRVAPLERARSTSPITIQFSEPMDRESVEARLRTEPPLEGEFSWSGSSVSFRPHTPLQPGMTYTVILEKGARSDQGREVLSEHRYRFSVAQPRVAYLAPADGAPHNIWLASIDDPESAVQVTFSPTGVYDFGVSPDGNRIAFAERNAETGTSDIKLLDLETGGITQLTNCQDADCTSPVWRPDGRVIAYNRTEYNRDLESVGPGPMRVWLLDLSSSPATTRPLFSDLQVLGYGPQWSADGQRISLYNRDEGLLIYDFETNEITAVPSRSGNPGALSPDGARIVFPELTFVEGQETRSFLRMADLMSQQLRNLSSPDDPVHDDRAEWRPDGSALAVARRYLDERYTRGYQVVLMNPEDGSVEQLTDDPRYANAFFSWSPLGDPLVIQRFPELTEDGQPNPAGRPEIWVMDVETRALTLIAENAFHPRWAP